MASRDCEITKAAVTGPNRREACGSTCRLLLEDMVKTQAGSTNGKQAYRRQGREMIQVTSRRSGTRQHRRTRQKL